MFSFFIRKNTNKTRARAGILKTPHGKIYTPAFVPVATRGALRGIDFSLAKDIGVETFMINTFHFYINNTYKNTYKVVEKFGGLHKFLNKKVPLMTDSGGFQVFSLGFGMEEGVGKIAKSLDKNPKKKGKNLIKIDDDGIIFSSPIDSSKHRLTPETSIKIQKILGADLIFAFDECTSPFASYEYVENSLKKPIDGQRFP